MKTETPQLIDNKIRVHDPMRFRLVLVFVWSVIAIWAVTACEVLPSPREPSRTSSEFPQDEPSSTATFNLDITPVRIYPPTATIKPAPSATATRIGIPPSALPPGNYLVLDRLARDITPTSRVLAVLTPDLDELGILAHLPYYDGRLSPDGSMLAYDARYGFLKIRNLNDGQEIDLQLKNVLSVAWSPDGDSLLISDGEDSFNPEDPYSDVSVINLDTGEIQVLLDCSEDWSEPFECFVLDWSPDGRWIAFYADQDKSGTQNPQNGTYLLDASCISQPSTCKSVKYQILGGSAALSWSPDGDQLAIVSGWMGNDLFQIFDVTSWSFVQEFLTGKNITSITWSPDRDWIVYTTDNELGLLSPYTGETIAQRRLNPDSHTEIASRLTIPPSSE